MDLETVAKMHFKKLKIRPIAKTIEFTGRALPPIDDCWRIENLSKGKFRLVNYRTNHGLMLSVRDIEEFRGDPERTTHGLLYLRGQVVLKGSGVHIEANPQAVYRPGEWKVSS
jgi:hypothetical protein